MAETQEIREVVVAEKGTGRFQQAVSAGAHTLVADEPPALGGDGAGPAPYDYLLAALGTCTSMTLRLYADAKKLPLSGIRVALSHRKVDIEGRGTADMIERRITLLGPLTDEQRVRMLEVARRCPMHRTLAGSVDIASELVPPE